MTRFTDELAGLRELAGKQPLSLGQGLESLRERGDALFVAVIVLPFVLPLPAWGLSSIAGAVVILMGWGIFKQRKLWLPRRLRDRVLPVGVWEKVITMAVKVFNRLEKVLRPRWSFLFWPGAIHVLGIVMMLYGFLLALPLPIPGSNFVFAIVALPLALAVLERDGLFAMLGYALALAEIIMAVLFWELVSKAFVHTWQTVMHLFG